MEFDHNNVEQVVEEEDRLSSLPDELIHKILSRIDMKSAVQTCLLSSRWKLIWTSMTCLEFSILHLGYFRKFENFVTHFLSHRNHQVQVSSVKLFFYGPLSENFVRKIADYAFSHNVQKLEVFDIPGNSCHEDYPLWLLGSQSLKHFNLNSEVTLKTPLDFPALTTLHLSEIVLCGELFSKCVNLNYLSLGYFRIKDEGVFDIITPRLSKLMLFYGKGSLAINLIAPELEDLAIMDCSIKYLNAPPGLTYFCYTGQYWPMQLFEDRFHSLNKVYINLYFNGLPYKKEDARKTINMLQKLHSARYLTLNADTIECISLFPDLLSHLPSPFSNLICLTIDCSMKKDAAYKVEMSTEARNFFLDNSPNCKFIMELPEGC